MTISSFRLIPHIVVMLTTKHNDLIKADLTRWAEVFHLPAPTTTASYVLLFISFMTFTPEFRNVFYIRTGVGGKIFSWLCPPRATLEIASRNIGPGLFIQHGTSTLVFAQRIGKNCWINQQVTIGYSIGSESPIIGDNVRVSAGAKIFGSVTIGDNATIGPNTVVINDVPPNVTVLGVPGRVVWRTKS